MNPSSAELELEQVRDRIVELERLLEQKKKPPPTPIGMVVLIMGGFLVTFGSMLAASLYITVGRTLLEERLAPRPTPTATAGPTNRIMPLGNGSPPLGLYVNDDSTEDLVAVFKNEAYGGVDVVAVNGSTFQPIWHSGPYKLDREDGSSTTLKRVNDSIVLTNGKRLWVIEKTNGYLKGSLSTANDITSVCSALDGSSTAFLNHLDQQQTTTLTISETPALGALKATDSNMMKCDAWSGSPVTYDDDGVHRYVVTYGGQASGSYSGAFSFKSSNATIWQRELCAPGDEEREKQHGTTAFGGGKLFFAYRVGTDLKVQAHSSEGRAWVHQFPPTPQGVALVPRGMSATQSRVYLMAEDRLIILGTAVGNELATITAMP